MLKQVTIQNLFNFKNEVVFDLTNTGNDKTSNYVFNKDSISNFMLLYGKNNIGKTNFIKTIEFAQRFILTGDMNLKSYRPSLEELPSIFEFVFESERHEYRYGFEILTDSKVIKDEWFYSKLNHSSRESTIFERSSQKFHIDFGKGERENLKKIKETILYLNHLNAMTQVSEPISGLLEQVKKIRVIHCANINDDLTHHDLEMLREIKNSKYRTRILKSFFNTLDLDIVDANVIELGEREIEFLDKFRVYNATLEVNETGIKDLMDQYVDVVPSLIRRSITGYLTKGEHIDYVSVEFLHRSGISYGFRELSTGTKQIIRILLMIIDAIHSDKILFFDEIEIGLHQDLVELIVDVFSTIVDISPKIQFIISTHSATLLDYEFISNENKALMKFENGELIMDYLSNYKMREYHIPSKRYNLDAFRTNPNTNTLSELKSNILSIRDESN